MLQLPVPVYRNYGSNAWIVAAFRAGRSGPGQHEPALALGGRQRLDCVGHLRLLFKGGRAIKVVMWQSSEPNRIADVSE
jgi:hypothetical protein